MKRCMLAPPYAHAELQPLEAIEATHALVVDPPTLSAQQGTRMLADVCERAPARDVERLREVAGLRACV